MFILYKHKPISVNGIATKRKRDPQHWHYYGKCWVYGQGKWVVPFPDGVICAYHGRRMDEAGRNKEFIHTHVLKNKIIIMSELLCQSASNGERLIRFILNWGPTIYCSSMKLSDFILGYSQTGWDLFCARCSNQWRNQPSNHDAASQVIHSLWDQVDAGTMVWSPHHRADGSSDLPADDESSQRKDAMSVASRRDATVCHQEDGPCGMRSHPQGCRRTVWHNWLQTLGSAFAPLCSPWKHELCVSDLKRNPCEVVKRKIKPRGRWTDAN